MLPVLLIVQVFLNKESTRVKLPSYQHVNGPRHNEQCHEEVGHGERDDEVVGGGAEDLLRSHAQDDQDVAKGRDQGEEEHDQGPVVGTQPGQVDLGGVGRDDGRG